MSNHLNNLIARATAERAVLRARVPSLFEPLGSTTLDAATSGLESIDQAFMNSRENANGAVSVHQVGPRRTKHSQPEPRVDHGDTETAHRAAMAVLGERAGDPSAPSIPAPAGKRARSGPRRAEAPHRAEEQAIEAAPIANLRPAIPRDEAYTVVPSIDSLTIYEPPTIRSVASPGNPVTSVTTIHQRMGRAPRVSSNDQPQAGMGATHDVPRPQEPDIHVSIGRIEVRAVQPSATPPAKTMRRTLPISLKEYAQRRQQRSEP